MPITPSLHASRGDTTERGGRVAVLACGDQSVLRLAEGDSAETRKKQEAYQVSAAIRCAISFSAWDSAPCRLPCYRARRLLREATRSRGRLALSRERQRSSCPVATLQPPLPCASCAPGTGGTLSSESTRVRTGQQTPPVRHAPPRLAVCSASALGKNGHRLPWHRICEARQHADDCLSSTARRGRRPSLRCTEQAG